MNPAPDPISAVSPRFGYLPTLDGWRAAAIGLVLVSHGASSIRRVLPAGVVGRLGPLEEYGSVGVQLFFALSGFLICARLLDERDRRGRIDLRQFYLRRVFRILPPAFAFLGVAGLLGAAHIIPVFIHSWLVTALCLSNYIRPHAWYLGHFWSLAIEEHFYLLWPGLLVLTVGWRRGLACSVGLALAVAGWRCVSYKFGWYTSYATFEARTDLQADALLWGCAVAFAYVNPGARDRLARLLRPAGWTLALAMLVATAVWTPADWKLRQATLVGFRVLAPLVIVGTVLRPNGPVGRLLEWRPLRVMGWLSYSIYLWQQLFMVLDGARVPGLRLLQAMPWNLLATAGCATASYWVVEQPFIRLGHRLTATRPVVDPVAPAGRPAAANGVAPVVELLPVQP